MDPVAVQTPNGRPFTMLGRGDTSDNAVAVGVLLEDEYHLCGRSFSGWAIDIGAYTGAISVALALDNPGLRVVAIEPGPENVGIIAENVARNGVAARVMIECAAATMPGMPYMTLPYRYRSVGIEGGKAGPIVPPSYVEGIRYMAGIFNYADGEMDADEIVVPGVSLGELLDRYGIDRLALLKIDCEGCEWRFLTDPAVERADYIIGEYHHEPAIGNLTELLGATHEIHRLRIDAPDFGIFEAVRR